MLVACRLAGLSRLRGIMQASTGARNLGRYSVPATSPRGNGGPIGMRTNAGLSLNGCRCTLGGAGTALNFPIQARLGITNQPSSPSGFLRQTLAD